PPLLRSYLVYLVNNEQPEAAQAVWQRLMQLPEPFQGDYPFNGVAAYIEALLRGKETQKANVVWGQFQERWPDRRVPTNPANMINNGSFEEELLNGGFDWRFVAGEHVRIQTDNLYKQGGEKSLVITFDGKENLRFENVYQLIAVEPSTHYHFSGYMRTDSITSDRGPRFEI